jgi:RNA polymerase sigma-70 factor (ECF subfamily)
MDAAACLPAFKRRGGASLIAGRPRENNESKKMAHDPVADSELLARIAAGETDALRALYRIYGSRLYAHALRISGDPAAAEDIIQESLLAIWRGARRYRGEGRVVAWLLGIVHHKALKAVRSRRAFPLSEETKDIPSAAPSPDEAVFRNERSERIKTGLDRLSRKHRLVLDLVFFQGLSLAETAAVCDCPVGTVKSRLNQAKADLREILDRGGPRERIR